MSRTHACPQLSFQVKKTPQQLLLHIIVGLHGCIAMEERGAEGGVGGRGWGGGESELWLPERYDNRA